MSGRFWRRTQSSDGPPGPQRTVDPIQPRGATVRPLTTSDHASCLAPWLLENTMLRASQLPSWASWDPETLVLQIHTLRYWRGRPQPH